MLPNRIHHRVNTATTHKFTSDERDTENGQDHTWFSLYASTLGRLITPDPAGLAAVDPTNPQSWNRYAYVLNNPLAYVDPLGLQVAGPGQCETASSDPCGSGGGGIDTGGPDGGIGGAGGGLFGGFCDASNSCTLDVGFNGVPWNFSPGWIKGATSGPFALLSAQAQYVSQIYDPCVYQSSSPGNPSESVETNSNPQECTSKGGRWVQPGAMYVVDPNTGQVNVFQTGLGFDLGALQYQQYEGQFLINTMGQELANTFACVGAGAARGAGTGAVLGLLRGGVAGILPGAGWGAVGGTTNALLYSCHN